MAEGSSFQSFFQKVSMEDKVEYFFFLPNDADISETMLEINAVAQDLIGEYIWHQETFIVRYPTKEDADKFDAPIPLNVKYLYGSTRFGDNVEDEWFIVHVLMQLTTKFPDIVVRYEKL